MLMHQGIGLDRFNTMPRVRAVHALYECCGNVTWAARVAAGRAYPDHDALLAVVRRELPALSPADLDRAFDALPHEPRDDRTAQALATIVVARIERMLGPEGGWPEY